MCDLLTATLLLFDHFSARLGALVPAATRGPLTSQYHFDHFSARLGALVPAATRGPLTSQYHFDHFSARLAALVPAATRGPLTSHYIRPRPSRWRSRARSMR